MSQEPSTKSPFPFSMDEIISLLPEELVGERMIEGKMEQTIKTEGVKLLCKLVNTNDTRELGKLVGQISKDNKAMTLEEIRFVEQLNENLTQKRQQLAPNLYASIQLMCRRTLKKKSKQQRKKSRH